MQLLARDEVDFDRLVRLEQAVPVEPIDAVPAQQVSLSMRPLPGGNLVAWEQAGPAQALYLPPLTKYSVFVRQSPSRLAVQWRAGHFEARAAQVGEMVIVKPYQAIYFRNAEPSTNLHLAVSQDLLTRVTGHCYPVHDARLSLRDCFGERDMVVGSLGRALLEARAFSAGTAREFIEQVGVALAIHLLSHYAEQPVVVRGRLSEAQLAKAMAGLQDVHTDGLSVEALARDLGMTPYQFSKLFKASVGESPLRHWMRLRMTHARDLVRGTRRPLVDIAAELAFFDATHFSRAFKKFWGVTPSALRGGHEGLPEDLAG